MKQGIDIFERRVIEAEEAGDVEGVKEVRWCPGTVVNRFELLSGHFSRCVGD